MLSLCRGKSIVQRCQDSFTGTIWFTATTKITVGGLLLQVPVVDLSLSLDEEDFMADTSRDEDFTRWLFGELNRDVLGPPGDGKVIVLSDSDEEEEVREETVTDATPSANMKSSTSTTSATDAAEDSRKMQDDNSDDLAPGENTGKSSSDGDKAGSP
jgi:hypothetical protein